MFNNKFFIKINTVNIYIIRVFTRSFTIQGYKFAIFLSIIFHILVVLLLSHTKDKPIDNFTKIPKKVPINSFIYYEPIENKQEKVIPVDSEQKKLAQKKTEIKPSSPLKKAITAPLKKQQPDEVKHRTTSQNLSRLKDKINQQIIDQAMQNFVKSNTGTLMHGTPSYVPHSFVEDTQKKIIGSTASQVGNGFSITKDDKGTCTLTEDLSVIGLQGKTTSRFNCGLSKDEKNFKSHMKNVLKKLGH
ncbi:cell envelope integrity protein TolA [Colwellia sp. MB02u-14]|uniref:cell envelope integrity protein TolA n=1 Tax=Colwellia sp. MB02u-14 TaxID=2759815 RepID=UPI0015F40134|nr:cell envelope integrity protein TolA [Colwellia sp. MB02u-14]MBA6303699.1 cell envelope integrity protein TolA [Colwellia sp. MB02u-14]